MPTETVPEGVRIHGLHLARRGGHPRTGRMERFLKRLGIPVSQYLIWTGGQALNAFGSANPTWSQRSWEILVLENLDILHMSND